MFSMRYCSACKYKLESFSVLDVLFKFNNTAIECNHYPSRWLKVADVMLKKEKDQD